MSQFGSNSAAQQYRKRVDVPGASPMGIVVTPNAPGLVVNDAPSSGAILFGELYRALGMTDTTAALVGQSRAIAAREQQSKLNDLADATQAAYQEDAAALKQEADSQKRIDDMVATEAKAQYGLGVEQGQSLYLRAAEDAAAGRLDLTDNPEKSVDTYLHNATQGLDPDMAKGFHAYRDNLIALAYKQREVKAEAAKTQLFDHLSSAIVGGKDPTELKANLSAFNIKPEEFDRVLLDAAAAEARKPGGDPSKITAQLTDANLYPEKLAQIDAARNTTRDRAERQAIEDMRNQLGMLETDNVPIASRIAAAEAFKGKVPPSVLGSELTSLRSIQERQIREAEKQTKDSWRDANKAAASQQVRSAVRAGTAAGISDFTYNDPWEGPKSYTRHELLTPIMRDEFAQIAQSEPNPQLALAKQARVADQNGYQPPEWKQTMEAGGAAASFARLASSGDKVDVPPALESGYQLWRNLSSTDPAFLARMGIDRKTLDIYEAVDARGGTKDAFLEAARVAERWKPLPPDVENAVDTEAVAQIDGFLWFNSPVENKSDVSTAVSAEAKRLMRLGRDKESALEKATATIKADTHVVNGRAVLVNDPRLDANARQAFPTIADRFIKRYAESVGKTAGLTPENVTIDYRRDGYVLIDRDTLSIAPGSPDDVIITSREIQDEWMKMSQTEKYDAIIQKQSVKQARALEGFRRQQEANARQKANWEKEKNSPLNRLLGMTEDPTR